MASSSTYFSSGAGRAVGSTLGQASGPGSGTGGGVNRETLKGLQDVVWSDDEVSHCHVLRVGLFGTICTVGKP
jgi:hypothetical protein